jgi:hypothetical protein
MVKKHEISAGFMDEMALNIFWVKYPVISREIAK